MPRDPSNLTGVSTDAERQLLQFFNGTLLETFDAFVTSDGATVTMTLERAGGGDLTAVFSDGQTAIDTTPAISIDLTAGTNEDPQNNYIYILQTAPGTLVKSTSNWPSAVEHIKVAFFAVPTANRVNTLVAANNAVNVNQNWNDHAKDTDTNHGHLADLSERLRREPAAYHSGAQGVATQDGNDLWVSISAGVVYQMHEHTYNALDSDTAGAGDMILVPNDPDANFAAINSLNEITKYSGGGAIGNNKYVKFVLWGVANKTGGFSPMMINLPDGTREYNSTDAARIDVEGQANDTIPAAYRLESSTGFLIAAFICKHTATAMEIQETVDLRSEFPGSSSGSGTGGGDVSADAVLADNAIIRADGGAKGVQDSGVLIDDSDNVSGINDLTITGTASGIRLDDIDNPDGNTAITMLDKLLAFNYVAPTAGGGLGAFQIKAAGAMTGILVALEQTGGTAGAGVVLDLKAGDADVKPLVITSVYANSIEADKTFKTTLVTGTKPLDVASTTLCDSLNADLLDGSHASAFAASSHVHDGDTLELDGINSDGGSVFNFFTGGFGVLFDTFVEGITRLEVDNLCLDGNTLSSTDTNGDINISPDGTGVAKFGNVGDTSIGDATLRFFGPQTDLKIDLGDVTHRFNETHTKYLVLAILTDATRGAAGTKGRVIFNDDDGQLNIDNGTDWTLPDGTTT